jgi:dTDP-4-amino-4,6-dideoxygalactose transaminase
MFMPALLPPGWAERRALLIGVMAKHGIGMAHYFSPHLAEHPFFAGQCKISDLTTTREIAGRVLSLPMSDTMTVEDVGRVCATLSHEMEGMT